MIDPNGTTPQINPDTANYTTILIRALSPRDMAMWLRARLSEDEILDLLKRAADRYGWTPQLNELALRILKPDAPDGEELWS